jgi:hypothetical protein
MPQGVTLHDNQGNRQGVDGSEIYVKSKQIGITYTGTKSVSVTTVAQEVTKINSDRTFLKLKNLSPYDFSIGLNDSTTTGDGYILYAGSSEDFPISPSTAFYVTLGADSGSGDMRVLEGYY